MRFVYLAHFSPGGSRKPRQGKGSKTRVNEDISAKEVRVIDTEGKMLGVEIAPNAKPPVCKIIDHGKYMYEQQKKEKYQRKQQQNQQMKEIRFKWRTDTHDFNFKTRHAREFLEEGNKVKASVMFRGREIVHKDIGLELLERFVVELEDIAKLDMPLKSEGKQIFVVLSPDKGKSKKKNN